MEDRNGVRTCVTCELFAERTKEGSRLVAEVPLGWFMSLHAFGTSIASDAFSLQMQLRMVSLLEIAC